MSAYIQGNLALGEGRGHNSAVKGNSRPGKRKAVRAKSLPTPEKLLYLFTILMFCAVAGLITFRYAVAFEMNSQIVQIESEMSRLREENAAMKNEIAKLQDPERLIETGIQLGLAYPGDWTAVPTIGEVAIGAAE